LHFLKIRIFLQKGLDKHNPAFLSKLPVGQITCGRTPHGEPERCLTASSFMLFLKKQKCQKPMNLSPTTEKFILHWGEMGTRWGISRTVAQIHALLYLSERALNAEEIVDTLSVARSNVSTGLKELQGWGLVKVMHVMGDRRDHFVALQDITDLFRVIVEERKRREIDPTLALLRECVNEFDPKTEPFARQKIRTTLDFLELLNRWHDEMKGVPVPLLVTLLRMGGKVQKLLRKAA
jgi:DNA-binding transcriptional regulator GbsR (MarR family)